MIGRIIKQISNDYTVLCNNEEYVCKPRGKFRNLNLSPVVGDMVKIEDNIIIDILPRKNYLNRPRVANIDQAIVITSLKSPDFDTYLLDKLLAIIVFNKIKPIIVFSKSDLLDSKEIEDFKMYFDYYKTYFDVYMNYDVKNIFKDKISVFTGQSGAGKSTLLNKLGNLNIKTNEISKALNRGKHTTRHTELLDICGGLIADTPGFSAVDFSGMSKSDIRDSMVDFDVMCKYKDCMHDKEDECTVKKLVKSKTILKSRYDNYIKFIKE